ncbi:MAG: hypothetical protein MUC54_02960 [Chloroflexi bacterium]|jgi:hypothetical protein|nr:hypothetical protein [Chloroflexota bacterium]
MPKLSLYIPDDLWRRARAVDPNLNQSQVAQQALRQWVEVRPAQGSQVFEPPADSVTVPDGLVQRLATEAREQYQAAYRAAFQLAERISWGSLDELASRGWDWASWLRHGGREILPALPSWLRDGDPEASLTRRRYTTSTQGVIDGLRDIWESVHAASGRRQLPKPNADGPHQGVD